MIPTAKFIADLHRQVIAHAGHTKKAGPLLTLPVQSYETKFQVTYVT